MARSVRQRRETMQNMRIAFSHEGLTTLDIIGPHDVLSRLPEAEAISVGTTTGPFMADTGVLGLTATHTIDQVDAADILVVPGGVDGTFAAAADEKIQEWVRMIDANSTWTTSVCTGSLILGSAGVLNGKRATSHWAAVDALEGFGATPVRDERVVIDGKHVTAAGVSAGIDMALTLAAQIAGDDVAKTIQLASNTTRSHRSTAGRSTRPGRRSQRSPLGFSEPSDDCRTTRPDRGIQRGRPFRRSAERTRPGEVRRGRAASPWPSHRSPATRCGELVLRRSRSSRGIGRRHSAARRPRARGFETGPRSCDRLIVAASAAGDPLLTAVLVDIDHRRVEQARLDVVDPFACEQRPVVVAAQLTDAVDGVPGGQAGSRSAGRGRARKAEKNGRMPWNMASTPAHRSSASSPRSSASPGTIDSSPGTMASSSTASTASFVVTASIAPRMASMKPGWIE